MRLLDTTAIGAQAARLVAAVVCSVSVTTAVTAPMAYQAVEFRRAAAVETGPAEAPAATPQRSGTGDGPSVIITPAGTPGPPSTAPAERVADSGPGPVRAASTPAVAAPTTTAATVAATVPPSTMVATTLRPVTDLSEFNPHPSCDDKAQELNVGSRPACPSPTSTP